MDSQLTHHPGIDIVAVLQQVDIEVGIAELMEEVVAAEQQQGE